MCRKSRSLFFPEAALSLNCTLELSFLIFSSQRKLNGFFAPDKINAPLISEIHHFLKSFESNNFPLRTRLLLFSRYSSKSIEINFSFSNISQRFFFAWKSAAVILLKWADLSRLQFIKWLSLSRYNECCLFKFSSPVSYKYS